MFRLKAYCMICIIPFICTPLKHYNFVSLNVSGTKMQPIYCKIVAQVSRAVDLSEDAVDEWWDKRNNIKGLLRMMWWQLEQDINRAIYNTLMRKLAR